MVLYLSQETCDKPAKATTPSPASSSTMASDLQRFSQSPARRAMTPEVSERRAPSLRRPQSVVTIIIGPEESKETFMVHKELICHYSSFFSTAFNSNFTETATKTMTLPDVDLDGFGLLVHWFYTQQIDLDPKDRDSNVLPLAKLWTLAERLLITKLQNNIMDKLRVSVEFAEKQNLKDFLHYAYALKDKSPLKRLAADRMAWCTTAQALGAWIEHLPEGMLVDIVMSLKKDHVRGKANENKGLGDAKEYYVEVKGVVKADPDEG
ncbi:hypothetical protein L207DRAFT_595480 [Hyaloscypha variabilis F]|uniref:BTB domain-containing protein n=1 Tax=Hyaloscypha variabilis (strain UAMH 11265 / GT02V1 / F) TaxID=1149755 RepID=A0A2J6SDW4_HYAVF|nr:hypothetical protein L207DRAFT_595480 [Hyaloscypha variabilis F]